MGPASLQPRRSGPALVVSLCVHVAVLAALLLSVRLPPPVAEAPAVQVSLIDLTPPERLLRPSLPTVRPLSPRPAPVPPVDAPPPPATLRGAAEREPGPSSAPPGRGDPQTFMNFFEDNLKGCEREVLILLPEAEQQRCRARIATAEAMKSRPFTRNGPPIEALSGLAAARRAALDAEVERRARARGPGKPPVTACEGRSANFGVGCLPDPAAD
jgi:hypothetical protein